MIKTSFEISNEEKNRILNLHESATKKLYLNEQEKESEGVRFNMPLPTSVVPGSTLSLEMIYNDGVLSYISEDGTMFNVPEKNEIVQSGVEEMPWIYDINRMIVRQNTNNFYIPSFDKNNLRLVWVICIFDESTNRFKMTEDGVKEIGYSIPKQD